MNIDIRYLAGLFDGEGFVSISVCVGRRANTLSHTLQVGLSNNYWPVIEEIQKDFGGYIRVRKPGTLRRQTHYVLTLCSNEASKFLRQLLPHLKIKRQIAELAIDFQESRSSLRQAGGPTPGQRMAELQRREDFRCRIMELNIRKHPKARRVPFPFPALPQV